MSAQSSADFDITPCAEALRRGDPDRFLAVMAAPAPARPLLFAVYAAALEIARAPWVTKEPMIAEMRLQWWHDALEEIAAQGIPRRHEIVTPLAAVLPPEAAQHFQIAIKARQWDIYKEAHADEAALLAYIEATSGAPIWAAMLALGAPQEAFKPAMAIARAGGLIRYFAALPALEEAGCIPLVDGRAEGIKDLASKAWSDFRGAKNLRRTVGPVISAPLLEAAMNAAALPAVIRAPMRVAHGAVGLSEARKRWRLMRLAGAKSWR
ncbi:MAG: squalene/phytoene synthase family protein [Paracoccaceae bacterium]